VQESSGTVTPPSGTTPSLVVKDSNNAPVSMIDGSGNLVAKGEVIVQGVPYTLNQEHGLNASGDLYSTYP
jgi:hypothetical protein